MPTSPALNFVTYAPAARNAAMMRSWIADSSGNYFLPRIIFIAILGSILAPAAGAMPIFFAPVMPFFFAAAIRASYLALLRAEIAFAFARASGLLDAPHA